MKLYEIDNSMKTENELKDLLLKADAFAELKHRQTPPRGTLPYIVHPREVSKVVGEALQSHPAVIRLTAMITALLHDTIEDTDATKDDIDSIFGSEIANYVADGLSDDPNLSKPAQKQAQVDTIAGKPFIVQIVKMVDKYLNTRDVVDNPPPRWKPQSYIGYARGNKKVVDKIRGISPYVEKLFDEQYQRAEAKWGSR